MKIAILTQPLAHNYGGILQAYALQKILKDLGHEVITIDRQNKKDILKTLRYFKNATYDRIVNKRKPFFSKRQIDYVYKNTIQFIHSNINRSEYIDNTLDLKSHFHKNNYDAIIVGSDQTWRPIYSPNIYNYFFDFLQDNAKIRKISYAASFGTDKWEFSDIETEKCKHLIQQFDAISVREYSGVDLCKQYFNSSAQVVLDPTLLLKKEDYIKVIDSSRRDLKPVNGIFTYILDKTANKTTLIKNASSLLGLPVFSNQPKEVYGKSSCMEVENYLYPPVEGWLNSFLKADFVIADSFHGIIFSIIFNKNFIAIGNKERGLSRFNSLLKLFDLEHRLIDEEGELAENLLYDEIDYVKVNSVLDKWRNESVDFLKNNL
ncbi:polysaccharide pyruvyl transferase family protein [Flavobacterium sp. 83]|uniref:polysaccharide pyruvyl transferase family protein n=1 Tax=Flavobacterium sp. 83 TaxID=1131812 RepID=UPI0005568D18|nr:polysaccharide pyruvyl transferase family protein [Flavobacterium sp. 83]